MWQQALVFCIVLAAALHVGARYLPAGWRARVVYFLTRRGARQSAVARWLGTGSSCGDGCSNCASSAPCGTAPAAPASPAGRRVIKLRVERRQ